MFKRTFVCIALSLCAAHATVTITAPAAGSSVASPFRVSATSSLSNTKQMQAYLDGSLVASSSSSTSLVATVSAAAGTHTLKVVATTKRGSTSQASESITIPAPVTSPTPPPPTSTSSGYGNVGDPYEGGTANLNAIPVTGCMTLSSNASYRLLNNIGTDAAATCLKITGANTVLDLGGYTVTGRINGLGYPDINGVVIFNGKVTCNYADNQGDVGCVILTSGASVAKLARLHHLTVLNTNTRTDMGGRAIHVEWSYQQTNTDPTAVQIDHITSDLNNAGGGRNYNLSIVASTNVEVAYNSTHCPSGSYACQGQVCYGTSWCKMHDNMITLDPDASGETSRGLLFDSAGGGEAWNNVIVANNNRAVRIRDSKNVRVHDNTIKNVTAGGTSQTQQIAAVHLADPDTGFTSAMNLEIDHNSFEMNGGTTVMTRGGSGMIFHDNTFTSLSGGSLARVRTWPYGASSITLTNNPSAATVLPAAQTTLETGTVATVCNSGTATGGGAVTYSCP